ESQIAPEKFRVALCRLVGPGLRHGGEEAEVARGARYIMIDALRNRLADIARLECPEFARALFDSVGEFAEDAGASFRAHPWPRAVIGCFARRDNCAIDVAVAGARDLRQLALSRRFDIGEARGLGRIDIAPGDEQSAFHVYGISRTLMSRNIAKPRAGSMSSPAPRARFP